MRTIAHRIFSLAGIAVAATSLIHCSYDECGEECEWHAPGGNSGAGGSSGKGGSTSGGAGDGGSSDAGAGGTSGNGGGGEAGSGGAACDTTKSPSEEPCLVGDDYAIFVAPGGDDDETGTQGAPVATLTKAIELAAGDKLVIVCNDTYDEHVAISEGARVFGGFSCDTWSAQAGAPLFKPTDAGPALKIDGVEDDVLIARIDFEVPGAVGAGASAVVAIVNTSPSVTLRGVALTAGAGQPGDDGTLTNFTYAAQSTLDGNPEEPATMGGTFKTCDCQDGLSSTGGGGGAPQPSGQDGGDGSPSHGGGLGGDATTQDCAGSPSSAGGKGANAPARPAASGAATPGTATAEGWEPTRGDDGLTGEPGQGGGGGASLNSTGHGGGGGCGGCGGNGGKGGQGGGGSIALLLIDSPVALESCTLTTSDAGEGGAGAVGQAGQQEVGGGGNSVTTLNSCAGGNGGQGGAGGSGGGGAGGVSVGIVWTGDAAPTMSDDTTISVGNAGLPGEGGAGTNDGIAGVAQDVLELP